jgi:hypothetical protein
LCSCFAAGINHQWEQADAVARSPGVVSGSAAAGGGIRLATRAVTADATTVAAGERERGDARRWLQLVLAAIWLLDGLLQFQSVMFTRAFGEMLAATAPGNPAVIAGPISWAAGIIEQHPAGTNSGFASIQLLLGLGLAFRPTVRAALAVSIGWSVAVWWLGEGLGGVLTGSASPLNGAPGAAILYALLAVLLWPRLGPRGRVATFVAAAAVGVPAARALWVLLWLSLAYFAIAPGNRTAQGLHDSVAGLAAGEPGWLARLNHASAGLLVDRGLAASIGLAVLLAAIAVGVLLPPRLARAGVILALVVSVMLWVVGQDLGGVLAGGATDVDSGALLALLALAYWPSVRGDWARRDLGEVGLVPVGPVPVGPVPVGPVPVGPEQSGPEQSGPEQSGPEPGDPEPGGAGRRRRERAAA